MKKKYANKFRDAVNLFQGKRYQQSLSICESLIKNNCKEEHVFYLTIDNKIGMERYEEAIIQLYKRIKYRPKNVHYRNVLTGILSRLGRNAEALEQYKILVTLEPKNYNVWSQLAGCYGQLGYFDEAISAGLKAVLLSPEFLPANMNLATAYDAINLTSEALKYYEISAEIEPDRAVIQCKLGDAYIATNDRKKAEVCYRKSIAIDPFYTHAYRQISRLNTYTSTEHEDFSLILSMLESYKLTDKQKSHLHFALGKMYEDCGVYDKSYQHYETANALEDAQCQFSKARNTNIVNQIQSYFNNDFIEQCAVSGSSSEVPVFVIGMPRSGTTLIEQIIASHPDCYGSGELYWFGQIESRLNAVLQSTEHYPDNISSLDNNSASLLANEYLSYLAKISGNKDYKKITDKLPGNFLHIGLISMLFPKAKFIHCKRNPMDTCFSIYSIYFPGSMSFSFNQENIASVYNDYHKLMSHWQKVLGDKIITVEYEDLINHQEEESRRIINFIGLDWSDSCLNFYNNKNSVKTVSAFQVKKGLYNTSINRWKNYKENLKPLYNALDKEVMQPYEND